MTLRSPALRHQARVLAELAAANTEPGGLTTGSQYEMQLYKLAEDRRRLKAIQSIKSKIDLKVKLLPEYADWVDGVLAAGKGAQDDVVTTILVWYIDVGQFERALQVARYAVLHKMTLPDQYNRDIPTMLLDEFADAYLNGNLAQDPQRAVQVLTAISELALESDTPDQARAKLHKALGLALLAMANDGDDKKEFTAADLPAAQAANEHLHRALELFNGVGVKKDIESLKRRLKKAA